MGKNQRQDVYGLGRTAKNEWDYVKMNQRTYQFYYDRLMELAINMFEWKNLPSSIDARFLELTLFGMGHALFFYDAELEDYLALTCTLQGKWDVYRRPINRRAYATNGYNKELTIKDSVLIYNNYLRRPSVMEIELFAQRIAKIERTIDVNVNAQKTPVMIVCNEGQRVTMKNFYDQYEENKPFIFGDNNIDLSGIKSISTKAEYVADKLESLKMQYWNEALTYLGISNTNTTKKERMISDEVNQNGEGTLMSRNTRLNARKEACKLINEMFSLNVDVVYREEVEQEAKLPESEVDANE